MTDRYNCDVAIIGGSGFSNLLEDSFIPELPTTPFGRPSSAISIGKFGNKQVAYLNRHGQGHQYNPSNVPNLANIYALKALGVRYIFATTAVGSLQAPYKPGCLLLPDQLIDLTRNRANTYFKSAIHVSMAKPFCNSLKKLFGDDMVTHGTYVCIEGPHFGTKAESHLYRRAYDADMVGMTIAPEAKLAREAQIAYCPLAIVTDYDCWKTADKPVSAKAVSKTMAKAVSSASEALCEAISKLYLGMECDAHFSLKEACMTSDMMLKTSHEYVLLQRFRNGVNCLALKSPLDEWDNV